MEPTFNITVTKSHLDILGAGLGKLPLEVSLPVYESVRDQVNAQMAQQASVQLPSGAVASDAAEEERVA